MHVIIPHSINSLDGGQVKPKFTANISYVEKHQTITILYSDYDSVCKFSCSLFLTRVKESAYECVQAALVCQYGVSAKPNIFQRWLSKWERRIWPRLMPQSPLTAIETHIPYLWTECAVSTYNIHIKICSLHRLSIWILVFFSALCILFDSFVNFRILKMNMY